MAKKAIYTIVVLLTFVVSSAFAQLDTDKYKYYRVQNSKSLRYLSVRDDVGSINKSNLTADFNAIDIISGAENVVSDPGSIIGIVDEGAGYYGLEAQGTSVSEIVSGVKVIITDNEDGTYLVCGTAKGSKGGLSGSGNAYLLDPGSGDVLSFIVSTKVGAKAKGTGNWKVLPVDSNDGTNFFGVDMSLYAEGKYYTTLYTSFAYTLSPDMTAYAISEVADGKVTLQDLGSYVPEETPVILESYYSSASANRLQPVVGEGSVPGNLLKGVYFNHNRGGIHTVRTAFDKNTMRVLKVVDGEITLSDEGDEYLPANSAYLSVPAGTPSVLKFGVKTAIMEIQTDQGKTGRVYDLQGRQVRNPQQKGIYIVDGKKVVGK